MIAVLMPWLASRCESFLSAKNNVAPLTRRTTARIVSPMHKLHVVPCTRLLFEDPKNPEMRIYTVFRDIKDSSPLALSCQCKIQTF